MSSIKVCTNCKYCITFNRTAHQFECEAPQNFSPNINLVTGWKTAIEPSCYAARYTEASCGKQGKWFVQKEIQSIHLMTPPKKSPISQAIKEQTQKSSVEELGL